MSTLIRDGEVAERVVEWEAKRAAERKLLKEKLSLLGNGGGGKVVYSPVSKTSESEDSPSKEVLSEYGVRSRTLSFAALSTDTPTLPPNAAGTPLAVHEKSRTERRLDNLEHTVVKLRMALVNAVDENRFLRLEVDLLREALLGGFNGHAGSSPTARDKAMQALELVGRRTGVQELRDSVCTHCLTRARCFRCYACRSVEYCSARCQMENFGSHVELCRHITERVT